MPALLTFFISWVVSFALIFLTEVSLLGHDISDVMVLCRGIGISWVIALLFALGASFKGRSAFQLMPETSGRKNPADAEYDQYQGGVAGGGHLYFFPECLVFHPNASNPNRSDIKIRYANIATVKPSMLNTILITTKDGSVHRFTVNDKNQWVSDIMAKADNNNNVSA